MAYAGETVKEKLTKVSYLQTEEFPVNTPTRLVSLSGAIRRDLEISTNAVQFLTPYATDPTSFYSILADS